MHLRELKIFWGACPQTPLKGCLRKQAAFDSLCPTITFSGYITAMYSNFYPRMTVFLITFTLYRNGHLDIAEYLREKSELA